MNRRWDGTPAHDLASVLGRLAGETSATRKTTATRRRLANDPLTREYLEAGRRVVALRFAPGPGGRGDVSPFLDWLTQHTVIEEVARGPAGLRGSLGSFRDRWPFRSYYVDDLVAYSLWRRGVAATGPSPAAEGDLDVLRDLAERDLRVLLADPAHRLSLVVAAAGGAGAGTLYRELRTNWAAGYRVALAGRRLRPGVTVDDLAVLATALVEGVALLTFAGEAGTGDGGRSLLGTAITALTAACLDGSPDHGYRSHE